MTEIKSGNASYTLGGCCGCWEGPEGSTSATEPFDYMELVETEHLRHLEAVARAARQAKRILEHDGVGLAEVTAEAWSILYDALAVLDDDGVEHDVVQETHSRCPECGQLMGDVS